jgi:tetratricopeptide (TPR) repeat protein
MKRRNRTASIVATVLVVGLSVAAAGCGKYSWGNLKAMKSFKDANDHYKAQQWDEAVQNYEAAVSSNPDLIAAYFFLGNSYDNLYKPSRVGEPENDAYMQKAIANYKIAAERETNPQMKKLALDYLVAAYGPEKLNDPSQAEPIVQQMIQMDANDVSAYFQLSKIYEDAGRYEEAEAALLKAREVKPKDPAVYTAISGYYNRQGEFDKTMEALHQAAELEPNNPEGYQRVAVFYWEKAFRDHRLPKEEKVDYIEKGIAAADKAISLNPNYAEALTYKNILLRMAANETTDMAKRNQLIKEADELRNKAMELNKKKPAGAQ